MNYNILNVCPKESAYRYRPETDVLFKLSDGAFNYTGIIDKAIRHIEKIQSLREDLWEVFVKQFSFTPDDDNRWRCEYWGKMMRGACMTYQYTQNEKLYKVLEQAVKGLMATQDELGRISTYSVEKEFHGWDVWGRKYVMLGFQYFLDICRDEEFKKEILQCMCRHADYIVSKIGYPQEGKKHITDCSEYLKGINCSSILEPFVRLYNLTGNKSYLDFASYIVDIGGMADGDMFGLICEGQLNPYEMPVTKAYEMMSCLEGLTEYYRVTKIEKYRKALSDFAKKIAQTDISIIGCSGCTHELFDFSTKMQTTTTTYDIMQETCVTVTWMKFCYQLLCLTGDSYFADCIEISSYNAMLGSVNTDCRTQNYGFPFDSYAPLYMDTRCRKIGGHNAMEDYSVHYGCCACIGAAGTSLIALSSVMQSENGLCFNLYIPGAVSAKTPCGTDFTVNVDTEYPVQPKIDISLSGVTGDEEFSISFRIPNWCKKASLKVGGEEIAVTSGEYAKITRKWTCSDKIELDFEIGMELIKAPFGGIEGDKGSKNLIALRRGPVVFARDRRLGEKIDSLIDVKVYDDGYIDAIPSSKADFDTEQEYTIPMKDGSSITVIDYQSAGKTWNEDSMMTVWMPVANYWDVDFNTPVRFNNRIFFPAVDEYGNIIDNSEIYSAQSWIFEKIGENRFMIKHSSGKYLTAVFGESEECPFVYLKDKGEGEQVWNLHNYAVNLYRLCLDGTDLAFSYYYYTNRFALFDYKKDLTLGAHNIPNNAFINIYNI